MEHFNLFVIGGGPGGYEAALEAAALGKKVAVAEERQLGGVCLNRGCIPTKALLRSARLYQETKNGADLGVYTEGVTADLAAMHAHAAEIQKKLRDGIAFLFQKGKIAYYEAHATVAAPGVVQVGAEQVTADHILMATGSRPARLPLPGMELAGVITSDDLLTAPGVDCAHLVIIGGGVIGVEFAELYGALGKQVTIIEALPRILEKLDREISQNMTMLLKKRGAQVVTGASVTGVVQGAGGLTCCFTGKDGEERVTGDRVLVCTGRRPNTENLVPDGMDLGMVKGYLPVDENGRTKVPGLYAVGDLVLGGIQLAHAASAQGKQAVRAMFGAPVTDHLGPIPACVFASPEIAVVGMTADEAKKAGIPVQVKKAITSANGKSLVDGSDRGFAKLVFHKETGALLGAQLMCYHASEMIGGLTVAVRAGLTEAQMVGTVYPHPTVSEILAF